MQLTKHVQIEQMLAGQWFQIEEHEARLAELDAWQEEEQLPLPMPADLILWLEDKGFVVDLLTGCTERMEPLQTLIDEALAPPTRDQRADEAAALADTARYYEWLKAEREDYADYVADVDWLRHGC